MNIENIEMLTQVLSRSRLSSIQFDGPGTFLLLKRKTVANAVVETPDDAGAPIVLPHAVKRIKAGATGTLMLSRLGSFQLPGVGDIVSQGDLVAFVRVGNAISAVVSSEQGTLSKTLSKDGGRVGYDSVLHELI